MIVGQLVESTGIGGAENLAVQIANALAARGHRSWVYVLDRPGLLEKKLSPDVGLHHFHYRRDSILNPFKFTVSVSRGFRMLRRRLRADGVEVLQCHLPTPNMWGLAMAASGTCRVIATIHNNREFSYGSDKSMRGSLRHVVYRQVVRRCDAVVAVSEQVRQSFLKELGLTAEQAPRLVAVANGVPIPPPPSPAERQAVRARQGVGEGEALLLGVGRLCEQKNFGDLVAAAAHLREAGVPFRAVVAGDGPLRGDLEADIAQGGLQDTVTLLGAVDDVTPLLQAADMLVMPSLWEGLPLALLEAMACGLPVVGYAIDGLSDVVEDGRHGLLVPKGDTAALAAACRRLVEDPELRERLGRSGRELVEQRFGFDRTIEQLLELYEGRRPGSGAHR